MEIKNLKKIMLISAGILFVMLGIVGFFLPIMPVIPFLIIASVCFSKSSKKLHNMLLNNKLVGPHIKNYYENNGLKPGTKAVLIISQWVGAGLVALFFVHGLFGRVLLAIIAAGATGYIASLKTAKQ